MKASISSTPLALAASAATMAAAWFMPIGFSQRTCFPASAAFTTHSMCCGWGVAM